MGALSAALANAPALHTLSLSGTRALRSLVELCPAHGVGMAAPGGSEEHAQAPGGDADTAATEDAEERAGLLSRLRSLDLACCRQLADVGSLAQCKQLLFLSLRECRVLASLEGLGACAQLKELILNGCRSLDPSALREVGRCANLIKLSISNCRALSDIEGLRGCTQLERLDLGGCRTLRSLNALSDVRGSLAWLNLSGCEKLDDIAGLTGSRCLHTVNLSFCSGEYGTYLARRRAL